MNEFMAHGLYLTHAIIVWLGSIREISHIYKHKSARDLTRFWIVCLLIAELIALPLALSSGYTLWWLCHVVGACLVTVLLIGVKLYGNKNL